MNNESLRASTTRDELLALAPRQRLHAVEHMRVIYPRWNTVLEKIAACHELQPDAAEPPCLLLVGPTGAGKSTLIQSYMQRYPRIITAQHTQIPVLCATIPSKATVKSMVVELLYRLGDPRANSGTVIGMTKRLCGFIEDCGVRLMILDELQHFVDQESQRILLNASNWLKELIKETRVACVFVGLSGQAERVVDTNEQLARLFADPEELAPFCWNESQPETIEEFRTFLVQLEALLPLREPSNLVVRDRAWRCFVASEGIVAYLMALIRQATRDALLTGRECLDDVCLAQAFDKRLAGKRRNILNPFIGNSPLPKRPLPKAPPPLEPIIGQRGRRPKAKKVTLRDIRR
jgi:hypothetical protein